GWWGVAAGCARGGGGCPLAPLPPRAIAPVVVYVAAVSSVAAAGAAATPARLQPQRDARSTDGASRAAVDVDRALAAHDRREQVDDAAPAASAGCVVRARAGPAAPRRGDRALSP